MMLPEELVLAQVCDFCFFSNLRLDPNLSFICKTDFGCLLLPSEETGILGKLLSFLQDFLRIFNNFCFYVISPRTEKFANAEDQKDCPQNIMAGHRPGH